MPHLPLLSRLRRGPVFKPVRSAVLALALGLVVGCGGGGGGGPVTFAPDPALPVPGIWGRVRAPDIHMGRIAEREPNDVAGQAWRLPPLQARSLLEVAGNLGVTAAYYGTSDASDVLAVRSLDAADVALSLSYRLVDPVLGGQNVVRVEVRSADGTLLTQDAGSSPLTLVFSTPATTPVLVHVIADAGHTPWLLSLTTSDPPPTPPSPKPSPLTFALAPSAGPLATGCSEEHVLVRLKPGVDAADWAARHGHVLGAATATGSLRVRLLPDDPTAAGGARKASKAYASDPDVLWSEPDWRVFPCGTSNDPDLARQWNLHAIGALEAWDITRGSSAVVVGVIDSGVIAHPDLAGQIVTGYDFVSDPGISRDGDGRDQDPTDTGDSGVSSGLSTWHGTHVATIVAGRGDDGQGISGVAPGCRVMPLRALGFGGGLVSDVTDALLFAAGQFTTVEGRRLATPLRVVNLSLGTANYSAELDSACSGAFNLGVLIVAATGNTGGALLYPAALPTVTAVGAVDGLLDRTSYSNYGAEIDLCAPGGLALRDQQGDGWPDSILSASRDQTLAPSPFALQYLNGTSQAAPHVSGAAALLLSLSPGASIATLRQHLEQSALDRGQPGPDPLHGYGVVQAASALKAMLTSLGTPLLGPARLHLPIPTLQLLGLESSRRVPLVNVGGGVLLLVGTQAVTEDGGDWLGATPIAGGPGADTNAAQLEVIVDRTRLPLGPSWSSGTLRLYGPDGALGLLRVTVAAGIWPRAGSMIRLVAIDAADGGVDSDALASAQNDYRYVLSKLVTASYKIRAGDDLDGDAFFCEPGDLCGWFGGLTEASAVAIPYTAGAVLTGRDITLAVPPPTPPPGP